MAAVVRALLRPIANTSVLTSRAVLIRATAAIFPSRWLCTPKTPPATASEHTFPSKRPYFTDLATETLNEEYRRFFIDLQEDEAHKKYIKIAEFSKGKRNNIRCPAEDGQQLADTILTATNEAKKAREADFVQVRDVGYVYLSDDKTKFLAVKMGCNRSGAYIVIEERWHTSGNNQQSRKIFAEADTGVALAGCIGKVLAARN